MARLAANDANDPVGTSDIDAHFFNFVYIDGSHLKADILSDVVMVWPLLMDGGVILFDDYLGGDASEFDKGCKDCEFAMGRDPRLFPDAGMPTIDRPYTDRDGDYPKIGIDAFLVAFQGQCEILFIGYQLALKKVVSATPAYFDVAAEMLS